MKVHGHEITGIVTQSAFEDMPIDFHFYRLQRALEDYGVPAASDISMRAAVRLLQKWRRQGLVEFDRKKRGWRKTRLAGEAMGLVVPRKERG